MSTTDTIVSGLASYERASVTIGGILGFIFALIFIGIGIYILVQQRNYQSVTGTIVDLSCNRIGTKISCLLDVQYQPKNSSSTITSKITLEPLIGYSVGQKIDIVYDIRDPKTIYNSSQNSLFLPILFIVIGVITIIGIIIYLYFSYTSRAFAAVVGGEMLARDAGLLIRNLY